MSDEARFEALLAEHEQGKGEDRVRLQALQEKMTTALRARYKRETGRRWSPDQAVKQSWYPEFFAGWRMKAEALISDAEDRVRDEQARLRAFADLVAVPDSEDEIEIERYSGASWSTQGFGANAYAKGMAEAIADKVTLYGIGVEVRPVEKSDRPGGFETYAVFAQTTPAGKALLTFKADPELREQVRMMWKRGTNPRVYMPFLPSDFEARNGIDYHGNDLSQRLATAASR